MRLWRISNHADLRGIGGLRASARWHNRGRPIVYLAESPPGALIEVLAHMDGASLGSLPVHYRLLTVDVPEDVAIATCPALPPEWPSRVDITRAVGDAWLTDGSSALLRVPSAIMPDVFNLLLNPLHPEVGRIRVADVREVPFDPRLFRRGDADR